MVRRLARTLVCFCFFYYAYYKESPPTDTPVQYGSSPSSVRGLTQRLNQTGETTIHFLHATPSPVVQLLLIALRHGNIQGQAEEGKSLGRGAEAKPACELESPGTI